MYREVPDEERPGRFGLFGSRDVHSEIHRWHLDIGEVYSAALLLPIIYAELKLSIPSQAFPLVFFSLFLA